MKCELCKTQDASVHLKQVVNGGVREMHVCHECAAKNGFDLQSPMALTDFLFGLASPESPPEEPEDKTCPGCRLTLKQFRKVSRVGCARCYETFAEELKSMLAAMQGADRHTGKVPAREQIGTRIQTLRRAMEKAVRAEDFEEAARLRDAMGKLKAQHAKAKAGVGKREVSR